MYKKQPNKTHVRFWKFPTRIFLSSRRMQQYIETQLQPHQQFAVKWIQQCESRPGFVGGFNMDEVGLGKTRETLGAINSNTIVVCPAAIVDVWVEEATKSNWPGKVMVYNGTKRSLSMDDLIGSTSDEPLLLVTSYNVLNTDFKLMKLPATAETKTKTKKPVAKKRKITTTTTNPTTTVTFGTEKVLNRTFIFNYKWPRIILDEAQMIRNQNTQYFKSVCALNGRFRWCITATPIYNHFDEFYTQVMFLRITPWSVDPRTWRADVIQPLENHGPLNPQLRSLILQRKKQEVLRDLPPVIEHQINLKLSPEERLLYDSIYNYGRAATKRLIELMTSMETLMNAQKDRVENRIKRKRRIWGVSVSAEDDNWKSTDEDRLHWNEIRRRSNASIGTFILRLRQMCVAPTVVINAKSGFAASKNKNKNNDDNEDDDDDDDDNDNDQESDTDTDQDTSTTTTTTTTTATTDILANLKRLLTQVDLKRLEDDCPVCMESNADRFAEPCLHQCCENCWLKMSEETPEGRPKCPLCRQTVLSFSKREQVKQEITKSIKQLETTEDDDEQSTPPPPPQPSPYDKWQPLESTKFRWVAEDIARHDRGYLIVSQWTTVLDEFYKYLGTTLIGISEPMPFRYDGRVSGPRRTEIRQQYQNDPNAPRGMLTSLQCASVGVTLTRASVVYFLDQWWNSAVDFQMANRVHRIGQLSQVDIYYLHVDNTIEDSMVIMREMKAKIAEMVNVKRTKQTNEQVNLTSKARLVFKLNDKR